jgi:hypothetical protein
MATFQFTNVEKTAQEMAKIFFSYQTQALQVFFKTVFRNMTDFWKGV